MAREEQRQHLIAQLLIRHGLSIVVTRAQEHRQQVHPFGVLLATRRVDQRVDQLVQLGGEALDRGWEINSGLSTMYLP